ncbi:YqgE/AlgH family protein [Solirhodobacter olei]|uniref:YqgE/AlgH family protein n=1 Tax=Solirhodobacter olei TaxID=2493082 RepID=UPI000FD7DB7F|nr:YqgE/AlgH family protein [Solirhodobacter olei]
MDLTGKFLIAMPGMGDPRFETALILVCAHSDDGAMGLIVNKPLPEPGFRRLLEQLEITPGPDCADVKVQFGGPVENGRGFVLHSPEYSAEDGTMPIDETFGMTATLQVLEDLARGKGPERALLALGYAGWGPGQIESEILRNGWLSCEASPEIVFSLDNATKWERALKTIGVDALTLSSTAGRA